MPLQGVILCWQVPGSKFESFGLAVFGKGKCGSAPQVPESALCYSAEKNCLQSIKHSQRVARLMVRNMYCVTSLKHDKANEQGELKNLDSRPQ